MRPSLTTTAESIGTFSHIATASFYGTKIEPPLQLEISYEMHRGRPVYREAVDQRGQTHEIELLNQSELQRSFDRSTNTDEPILTAE